MKYFFWLMMAVFFLSCDTNRVFEDNVDLEGNYWTKDDLISFEFEIPDTQLPYNLYTNIRNASAYPYHNLYYQYTLKDSSGTILEKKQQYIDLFDPKTGEPYGSGLGDLFDHQQLILENYEFTSPGMYSITFQQYMRRDTLPLILAVGARVEWAVSKAATPHHSLIPGRRYGRLGPDSNDRSGFERIEELQIGNVAEILSVSGDEL